MNLKLFLYHSWILLVTASVVSAATYEVAQRDPHASDDGDGSPARPWLTIAQAAATARAGDTVNIHDGIYREAVVLKANGTAQAPIDFAAAPGAHVLVTGADRLTGWQKARETQSVYRVPWLHRFPTHPNDDYHRLIGRCEQVAVDGYLLRQVLAADQLAPGAFFVNASNQMLDVWDAGNRDLNRTLAEASARPDILRVEGDYVGVRGLHFQFAANMAQHGAVQLDGIHDTLEDCTIDAMNGSGATFAGEHLIVRRCTFRDNGQLGFGAHNAHDLLVTECVVENNNTKGFSRGWEAGGDKLVLCRDAILERSQFLRNRGSGIWFDIGNEHCVVRQCLIADNEDAGIFDEISYGLEARDNVIVGNGFAGGAGSWGAAAGISLSSSPDSVIERNLIVGNREGFDFREQMRTTRRIGGSKTEEAVWNHDETIRRNIIAFNRDAQIGGWFDVKDSRHWPAQKSETVPAAWVATAKPADIAAPYVARTPAGQPTGLTLEKLHLSFAENVYYAGTGQHWFGWGVTWSRHQSYASLADFQADLGIDQGSRALVPAFANLDALDFRLKPEAMAALLSCYPQGPVPGVTLGVQP